MQRVRVGRHPGGLTRVVLDLDGAGRHSVYSLYNPYRVVVDVEAAGRPGLAAPAAPAASDAGRRPHHGAAAPGGLDAGRQPAPSRSAHGARRARGVRPSRRPRPLGLARVSEPIIVTAAAASAAAIDPAAAGRRRRQRARGDFSLSRQLGLGIARIVIDAGHGGHDPGAKVTRACSEADLTLDIALRLEKLLRKQPGVEVVQTRRKDAYVPLEERAEIANRAGADLFLSIHANASTNPRARGVETYVPELRADCRGRGVAARENAASARADAPAARHRARPSRSTTSWTSRATSRGSCRIRCSRR